ncbi:MAG: bifunctional UDP-sugar hydrolase/5'-nucleotidase, partial [Candidatus Neomarinimicrobiota bacterium]
SFSRDSSGSDIADQSRIVILYTNDEHGWMEPTESTGGAAGLLGLLEEVEGLSANGPYLILSGGDMWTGPAISTWFEGESMVEVMNVMGYRAAAIGNHEFDFTLDSLKARMAQSDFPLLSANIRLRADGSIPDYITPYVIKTVNDVRVGLIGLTTTSAYTSTAPVNVVDLDFIDYSQALSEYVPQAIAAGGELIIVVGHICEYEMRALAATAAALGVHILTGGHCNDLVAAEVDGVIILEGGSHLQTYARADIQFDRETGSILSAKLGTFENTGGTPDMGVTAVIAPWREALDAVLSDEIGYTGNGINRYSQEMRNMVTDSWLWAFPAADIALTNAGGIRQSINQGSITKETIVGLLPFVNDILKLELTGEQITTSYGSLIGGGIIRLNGYFHMDGSPIVADSVYSILTIDYLYSRPDYNFQFDDPDPIVMGVNYRQPVMDWIDSLDTTPADPLENYLDYTRRQ